MTTSYYFTYIHVCYKWPNEKKMCVTKTSMRVSLFLALALSPNRNNEIATTKPARKLLSFYLPAARRPCCYTSNTHANIAQETLECSYLFSLHFSQQPHPLALTIWISIHYIIYWYFMRTFWKMFTSHPPFL